MSVHVNWTTLRADRRSLEGQDLERFIHSDFEAVAKSAWPAQYPRAAGTSNDRIGIEL